MDFTRALSARHTRVEGQSLGRGSYPVAIPYPIRTGTTFWSTGKVTGDSRNKFGCSSGTRPRQASMALARRSEYASGRCRNCTGNSETGWGKLNKGQDSIKGQYQIGLGHDGMQANTYSHFLVPIAYAGTVSHARFIGI